MTGQTHSVSIRRQFPASPERVFRAWTDPDLLAQWFGPEGFTCPDCDLDFRVGGSFRLSLLSPDGDKIWLGGQYQEIAPPTRLVFTWRWEDDHPDRQDTSRVTLELRPAAQGTELELTHDLFTTPEAADRHNRGWTSTLNDLARFLA